MAKKKESMYMKEDEDKDEVEKTEEESEEEKLSKENETESEDEVEKAEDEDEEEDEEDVEKGELGGENPEESNANATTAGHTTTSSPVIGNRQHVLVPNSNVAGKRNASPGSFAGGQSPSEVTYAGKSTKVDLLKSPLYVNLSKQLASFEKTMQIKVDAMVKSFEARFENLSRALNVLENMPLRKALNEDVSGTQNPAESFEKKIESGKVKFQ